MPDIVTDSPIAERIVDQAVAWYVRAASGGLAPEEHAALANWRRADPMHEQAWQRLGTMQSLMQDGVQSMGAAPVRNMLSRAAMVERRRRVLKLLLLSAGGGLAAYGVHEHEAMRTQLAGWSADVRTGKGEWQDITLPDGSRLQLNTATAVNLAYDGHMRRIELLYGEIMVTTASHAQGGAFVVTTREGELRPVGTRYVVRREAGVVQLAVLQGQVDIEGQAGVMRVLAGEQTRFTRTRLEAVRPLNETSQTWAEGRLTAAGMRLADFVAELSRYRTGHLACAETVSDLLVTGAWSLQGPNPTERILASLEQHLPVRISRLTRYWVILEAA